MPRQPPWQRGSPTRAFVSSANGIWNSHFVSYDSINMNGSRLMNLLSFQDFERALAAKAVPQFVFMSPNMMNDGHNTTLEYAMDWSNKFLKPILAENTFDDRTLIQLTYDESEDYSQPNRIVSLLLEQRHSGVAQRHGRQCLLYALQHPVDGTVQLGAPEPGPVRCWGERVPVGGRALVDTRTRRSRRTLCL